MITGLNHLTLAVTDLERSFQFYREVMGFKPLAKWPKGAYFLVGDLWFCLNVDPSRVPHADYTYYAFSVSDQDFDDISMRILNTGVEKFQENKSPGKSLYFLDTDGHKIELHAGNWQDRLVALKQQNNKAEFFNE